MLLFCLSDVPAQSVYPGQHEDKISVKNTLPLKAKSFDLGDVRLLDSRFKENMERESQWILSIGVDRLLHSFRTAAGVYSGNEGGYFTVKKLGGWESLDCELRGHTTGHILSGLALLYASTGNEIYRDKADSLVQGLAAVQQALAQNGFISAYPQKFIDRNIAGQRVWAPWYTLHKLYAGLIDQYLYCGNSQALEIVVNAADWAYNKLSPLPEETRETMLRNEFGGVNDAFYNLYAITGNDKHRWLARFFYHNDVIDPLKNQIDNFEAKHANTFIPKIIGEARNYEITGNEDSRMIAGFFWKTVVDHHTFVTGSNSDKEKFFAPDRISEHLTGYTGESCNVYNMLKLTRHLFCWDADVRYADYYERALYNHILGQQDPATGMISYFLPMLPGAHKVYSTPEQSFWCCVGTGFENQAKYGEAIYYHNDKGIFVNLFIPSELSWKEKGVKLSLQTNFPTGETSTLTIIEASTSEMPLYIRYPYWSEDIIVKINGRNIPIKQNPGSYITLSRKWKIGDKIEITCPMRLWIASANDNPDIGAIMYGPLVLAAEMGTEGFIPYAPYSNPALFNDYYTYNYNVPDHIINSLSIDRKDIGKSIVPAVGHSLTFKSIKEDIIFRPLYDIHRQRYNIYWNLINTLEYE
ncbi:MAG: glycoside hydrolase family 127 protein [Tannerella sp.]|jgi:DUF1680 family protein|nr:glycoside hydrolase family 127 protein [Tannerella sp.]